MNNYNNNFSVRPLSSQYNIQPHNNNECTHIYYLNFIEPRTQSILQKLQKLKQTMRPKSDQIYHNYENSGQKNIQYDQNNLYQNNHKQNQRLNLNKYLPEQQHYFLDRQGKLNQQQINSEYQSYRKSLQKKLQNLFDREKYILHSKNQSYPESNQNNANMNNMNNMNNFNINNKNYSRLNRQSQKLNSENNMNINLYKYNNNMSNTQISNMQRKIRILEMKYLGKYYDQNDQQKNKNNSPIDNSSSKRNRSKNKKQNMKNYKNNNKSSNTDSRKQQSSSSIQQNNNIYDSNFKRTKIKSQHMNHNNNKKKIKINSFLQKQFTTVQPQKHIKTLSSPIKQKNQSKQIQHLTLQVNQLKQDMQYLMQMNNNIIKNINDEKLQKQQKKMYKIRAKKMLLEILERLRDIKSEIAKKNNKNQEFNEINDKKNNKINIIQKVLQNYNHRNQGNELTDKPKDINKSAKDEQQKHKSIKQQQTIQVIPSKNTFQAKQHLEKVKNVNQLKRLLQVQMQHRQIVQKNVRFLMRQYLNRKYDDISDFRQFFIIIQLPLAKCNGLIIIE